MASRGSRPSALIASLALASLAIAPLFGAACGSNAEGPTDGGGAEASTAEAGDAGEDAFDFLLDSSIGTRCTMGNHTDPVGLCVQKLAILGEHAEFSSLTGMASAWSVDTLLPDTDDAGTTLHDVRDDVAYGASLADYYASATAYGDMDGLGTVTGDMDTVAQLLETELSPLPADYDGTLYLRLRRLAAGLRLAGFPTDGDAIDTIATSYGRAIFTRYYHALGPTLSPPDAGSDANAGDDGGADDAATDATAVDATVDAATEDAGTADAAASDAATAPPLGSEGILGVVADGGIAYESDKAASGALALVDMAARASGLSIPLEDGGADAAALDPTDALVWSQAAASVFSHLASSAHDSTGLYFTQLQTDEYSRDDTVTDDGSFLTQTQGGIALAYIRAARLVTLAGLKAPNAATLTQQALSVVVATQATTPASLSLWDTSYQAVSLAACTRPTPLSSCGSGFFAGLDATKTALDRSKGIVGNALMMAAIHRTSFAVTGFATNDPLEANDLPPLTALFTYLSPDLEDAGINVSFFSQGSEPSGFVEYVTQGLLLTEVREDGGLGLAVNDDGSVYAGAFAYPLARYYTAGATAAALEGMNDLWVGEPGAPSFFQ
jgi:hypothetical protein